MNILIEDTNGDLKRDVYKIYVDLPAIDASLSAERGEKRKLSIALNNVRLDSVANIKEATYKTFLAYNGTLDYAKKVFSTVVSESKGIFDINNYPVITFNPSDMTIPERDSLENVVIDIKMYNGTVDVLRYAEGVLNTGEKSYYVKSSRSYPTVVDKMPNCSGNKVFMDGWYSYTTIIFRHIELGYPMVKGTFYGLDGFIFKASDDGVINKNTNGKIVVVRAGDKTVNDGIIQKENSNYEDLLFSLNEVSGVASNASCVYIHSQLLIRDQLVDAITEEAVSAAFLDPEDYVDFQNWQKLTLKKTAAEVMFKNGLFESAQIIMESARALCTAGKYNTNCK